MFGILTKKDKRIIELEKELERLKFKPPMIQVESLKTVRLRSMVDIERGIPLGFFKGLAVVELIEKAKENVSFKVDILNGKEVLIGELKVVQPSEGDIS